MSIAPVAFQQVNAGEIAQFSAQTILPAGTAQTPQLMAEWKRTEGVPFADKGDGAGAFNWQTTLDDAGVYAVRVRAFLGQEQAFQDVYVSVNTVYAKPQALDLGLSTGTPLENNSESRVVSGPHPLTASYTYFHPQMTTDPTDYAEGSTVVFWYRNGEVVPAFTGSLMVPTAAVHGGDRWSFHVIPVTANYVIGDDTSSPTVTFLNGVEILSVTPNFGPEVGGTTVKVRVNNIKNILSIKFGGVPASSVQADSDTVLEVTAPLHVAGTVDVCVTTTAETARLRNAYTYQAAETPDVTVKARAIFGCGAGGPVGGGLGDGIVLAIAALVLAVAVRRTSALARS
jgi:hypothetical protein